MPITTPGRLMLDSALPEELRGKYTELGSKGLRELFQTIADKHPDQYRDIIHRFINVGGEAMYTSGGYSFGLKHLLPAKSFIEFRQKMQGEIDKVIANPKFSEAEKSKRIVALSGGQTPEITKKVFEESMNEKNPLALQIHSGAKGKPFNLMSIRGADLLYEDHHNRPIPIAVLRNYSEGLTPGEYWAGTYGARKGVVDLKMATQDAGYFGKQLTQATHRLLVTQLDHPDKDHDPDSPRGLPSTINDPDNEGALLAAAVGPYKRNTILSPKIIADLKRRGHEHILVRSPIIGGPPDGGVYARDVGIRERGTLSPIGDFVGIGASQAISEPVAQAQIGCLAAGTLVRMASNETRPIEAIKVGDMVLGANSRGETFPVEVTRCFDQGVKPCFSTNFKLFDENIILEATLDHKVLCSDGKQYSTATIIAQCIRLKLASGFGDSKHVSSYVTKSIGNQFTFDIEVNHPDHLFVLANGLVVSNSKHTGGIAGAGAGVSGFKAINQLIQVPKIFPGGAAHSQVDGRVQRIEPAPAGGYRVFINDTPHYVGVGFEVKVKPGDVVEAGDMISNGLPNPAEIVQHKHIGEGQRAFINAFRDTAKDANFNLHRRNIELVAKGLINHVSLKEQMGDYLPDDVIPYSTLEHTYLPRPGHRVVSPVDAQNHYLERPVLHYTIGTQLKPKMIDELKRFNVKRVTVHDEPPPFEPDMIRGMENLSHDPDWMTRMLGSNLEKGLLKAVHRGGVSDELGTSYVPSLARGVDFGKFPPIKGFDAAKLKQDKLKMSPSELLGG